MSQKKKATFSERHTYARLTRHERNTIEQMLDRAKSCRAIAFELGRSPSTVANEVARHRYVTAPRSMYGENAPDELGKVCPKLGEWPRCCNGCVRHRGYGCNRKPRVFYNAKMAQREADAMLVESRRGIDETETSVAIKLKTIRFCLARGLSPEQISATCGKDLGLSRSTIYRWVDAGYANMTNLDLRRKVGYKPRKGSPLRKRTSHGSHRSYDAFLKLGEDMCASAWEMDTVLGSKMDNVCLLTLLHRPSRFQLAIPLSSCSSEAVLKALKLVRLVVGDAGMLLLFNAVLTDNGSEFADDAAIAAGFGESQGETKLFYCDPRRSDQKAACEKNHVEIRKLLPKGVGLRFDRLTPADCALLMSQINSEPRGALAWMTPAEVFIAAFQDTAHTLMDAFGIELLDVEELNLTRDCIDKARRKRGDIPLA